MLRFVNGTFDFVNGKTTQKAPKNFFVGAFYCFNYKTTL